MHQPPHQYPRNAVLVAIENDRRFSQQKRKMIQHRHPSMFVNYKKTPNSESLRHQSGNLDFTNLLDLRQRSPKQSAAVMPPPRIRTEAAAPQLNTLDNHQATSRKRSRCNSASSHTSAKLRVRYSEMQRIREDNERIVEKILLAKPTLQNRKQHNLFFSKHREISKRLSRYSQSSPPRKRESSRQHLPK